MTYKALTYQPDGSAGFVETLAWKTELSTARDGTEVARATRAYPRYRYEVSLPAFDDASRQVLDDVRAWRGDWLVPLWPHVVAGESPPRAMDADGRLLCLMADGGWQETIGTPATGAVDTLPAGLGRLVDAARIQHMTNGFATVRVAFQLLNHRETLEWTDGTHAGLPLLDLVADWTNGLAEEITADSDFVDNDITFYERVRHIETRQTASLAAIGEDEIRKLRAFLFAMRGRAGRFYMSDPATGELTLYRLDADSVELAYRLHPDPALSYCTSSISLKRLQ